MENLFNNDINKLIKELKNKYNDKTLKKIKFKRLMVLIKYISNYKPKSKIKNEEDLILEYLSIINEKNLSKISKNELVNLQRKFIDPCVRKFLKYGFRFKFAWLFSLIFVLLFDFLILFLIFNTFIPVFSIVFSINQIFEEIKAYNDNKLW